MILYSYRKLELKVYNLQHRSGTRMEKEQMEIMKKNRFSDNYFQKLILSFNQYLQMF